MLARVLHYSGFDHALAHQVVSLSDSTKVNFKIQQETKTRNDVHTENGNDDLPSHRDMHGVSAIT